MQMGKTYEVAEIKELELGNAIELVETALEWFVDELDELLMDEAAVVVVLVVLLDGPLAC